mmetsp:Transcript_3901/g.12085  ORF Transcript_3901/g.12085 Transcript_3901/m.12085 type:complete len:290 (+) Transcript_3901:60-929(+)
MAAYVQQIQQAVEPVLEYWLTKRRRQEFLANAGPALLCLTFVEDALRVLLRWTEQMQFMTKTMKRGWLFGGLLLLISMVTQFAGSAMILRPAHYKPSRVKMGCYILLGFVFVQPFMYGQARDLDFICRSVTLAGGLLLLIWSENDKQQRSEDIGLPRAVEGASADRLQLSGRLLLCSLFFFQAMYSEKGGLHTLFTKPSFFTFVSFVTLIGLSALVCLGFKTEWSSLLLAVILFLSNLYMYPFWTVRESLKDFYRYYFFQTLSIIGGLMLLALHGPGGISLDKGMKKAI